jgi:hypothetical protein
LPASGISSVFGQDVASTLAIVATAGVGLAVSTVVASPVRPERLA